MNTDRLKKGSAAASTTNRKLLPAASKRASTPGAGRSIRNIQHIRFGVQVGFALLCVWVGVQFHLFVRYLETGGQSMQVARPPGVEGFLPIASLMNLYYSLLSGKIHGYHPAGVFILAAVILISLVFGKSFCSWLCPIGFISETVADLGERLIGRRLRMPRWLDYPLRSLKYLLLGFFLYSIFILMDAAALKAFLDSPYNLVSDIKMYYFFAHITRLSLIVIGVLLLASAFVRGAWCRYLCPYGALLGLASLLSPHKIRRDEHTCTSCGACAKACPSSIHVDRVRTVVSDECLTCLNCVDVCPSPSALDLKLVGTSRRVSPRVVAIAVVGLFMAVTGTAMLLGQWDNHVSDAEYRHHLPYVESYGHPTGPDDISRLKESKSAHP